MAGASKDVLAGGMQDLVPTVGWKGGSSALPISTLPVMIMVDKGWGVGMSNLEWQG